MSNGDKVDCIDIKVIHLRMAALSAGTASNNMMVLNIHLMGIVIHKNNNPVGVHYIERLSLGDLSLLNEAVTAQLENLPKQ